MEQPTGQKKMATPILLIRLPSSNDPGYREHMKNKNTVTVSFKHTTNYQHNFLGMGTTITSEESFPSEALEKSPYIRRNKNWYHKGSVFRMFHEFQAPLVLDRFSRPTASWTRKNLTFNHHMPADRQPKRHVNQESTLNLVSSPVFLSATPPDSRSAGWHRTL